MLSFTERTQREYRIPPWLGWAAAILCVVAGIVISFVFGKPSLDRARSSVHWPTTGGLIESSEVGRKTDTDGQLLYFTQIRYSYSVGSQPYESKTVWVGDDFFSSNPSSHEEIIRQFPSNTKVTVHYDPTHPEVAVLKPGLFLSNYGLFVAGTGLMSVGVWILFKTIQEGRIGNHQEVSVVKNKQEKGGK